MKLPLGLIMVVCLNLAIAGYFTYAKGAAAETGAAVGVSAGMIGVE